MMQKFFKVLRELKGLKFFLSVFTYFIKHVNVFDYTFDIRIYDTHMCVL